MSVSTRTWPNVQDYTNRLGSDDCHWGMQSSVFLQHFHLFYFIKSFVSIGEYCQVEFMLAKKTTLVHYLITNADCPHATPDWIWCMGTILARFLLHTPVTHTGLPVGIECLAPMTHSRSSTRRNGQKKYNVQPTTLTFITVSSHADR